MYLDLQDGPEVRYQISQIKDLPPLPESLQRFISIIKDEIGSVEELESIVRYDQSLAVKILRIANSTYYGCRRNVKTLSKAILLLGLKQTKSICLYTLLTAVFS